MTLCFTIQVAYGCTARRVISEDTSLYDSVIFTEFSRLPAPYHTSGLTGPVSASLGLCTYLGHCLIDGDTTSQTENSGEWEPVRCLFSVPTGT